jgi:2-(1,2-epoxy-1,2-dihydrophenyl)acetyl-CoA isomerase
VNRVVAESALEEQTLALASRLAHGPTVAYRYMKENINRALTGADLEECLDLEATHHVHTGLTEDHRDAARAFVEKRTPVFKGR